MKNPFRRITALETQVAALTNTNSILAAELISLTEKVAALVRDDQQIAALRRIQTAVEYLQKSDCHRREQAGQRTDF